MGGVRRDLPIVEVAPGVSVALFNMLGDTEVTESAGKALAKLLPPDIDVLVTPEVKALGLAHVISRESGLPYVVIRKTVKPYMVAPVARDVVSITTGKPQLLVLDGFDVPKIKGHKVAIVDDVVPAAARWRACARSSRKSAARWRRWWRSSPRARSVRKSRRWGICRCLPERLGHCLRAAELRPLSSLALIVKLSYK